MKMNLKRPALLCVAGILSLGILWTSCSRGGEPGPGGSGSSHSISDFQVTIINHGQDAPGSSYKIYTIVKNISSRDYGGIEHSIKCTVKDTQGALYQADEFISALDAGASSPENIYISFPAGKVANPSTMTYEVIED